MKLSRFLVWYIAGYTLKHALQLRILLMRSVSRHFSVSEREYAERVYMLYYKTHIGSVDTYWNPLFKKMKPKILKRGCGCTDDEIWDMILPVGLAQIRKIKKKLPSHSGKFKFLIPNLLETTASATKPILHDVIMYFRW